MEKVNGKESRAESGFIVSYHGKGPESSWALCHSSFGQGTSNPGMAYPPSCAGARNCLLPDTPAFCP